MKISRRKFNGFRANTMSKAFEACIADYTGDVC